MPSVNIYEYDKTNPGLISTANFAVVVPGKTGQTPTAQFDENNVYECSSAEDFKTKVGRLKSSTSAAVAADAPVEDSTHAITNETTFNNIRAAWTTSADWSVYLKIAGTSAKPITENGFLKKKQTTGTDYGYTYELIDISKSTYDSTKTYASLKDDQRGKDAISTGVNYGNEIAYRLLLLGYTVLFLKPKSDGTYNFEPLKDKSMYNFRYICNGGLSQLNTSIAGVAAASDDGTYTGRGDCIALLDIAPSTYESSDNPVTAIKDAATIQTKYATYIAPYVTYTDDAKLDVYQDTSDKVKLPGSFHYLVCAANAFKTYNEWYAVAGYTRGITPEYIIESTTPKFGELDATKLAIRPGTEDKLSDAEKIASVNLIIRTRRNNNGYVLCGNRTAAKISKTAKIKASHFLNIRQLCCTLKQDLYTICNSLKFDPNSDSLWFSFKMAIQPTLDRMKADQGIKDYRIIQGVSKEKASIAAIIRIVPIEAVEDFDINIYLEDSISGSVSTTIEG